MLQFHVTICTYVSYPCHYRVNNMLSKHFAVIIPLLSYQVTLIHSQSMLRCSTDIQYAYSVHAVCIRVCVRE